MYKLTQVTVIAILKIGSLKLVFAATCPIQWQGLLDVAEVRGFLPVVLSSAATQQEGFTCLAALLMLETHNLLVLENMLPVVVDQGIFCAPIRNESLFYLYMLQTIFQKLSQF